VIHEKVAANENVGADGKQEVRHDMEGGEEGERKEREEVIYNTVTTISNILYLNVYVNLIGF
jgi:hypothetical protein